MPCNRWQPSGGRTRGRASAGLRLYDSQAMESVLIFANPIAGRGRGKRIAAELRRRLSGRYDVHAFVQQADRVADHELPDDDVRAAIVIGGDGTLRGVTQRLFDRYGAERVPPLLVVPLGTANLMRKHLSLNWRDATLADQVADAIGQRRVVHLDAARANGRLFLLMAGVGIDAKVVHELDRLRSGPIDITSYALPAALALQGYAYSPIEVEIDGARVFGPAPGMVFVGNVPEYGTGFPVLPMARSDDGVLDVCVLPCRSRADLAHLLLNAISGEHVRGEGVVYTTAKRVRVTSDEDVPVQVDGEAFGHTPLEIEMIEQRIPFIVT